MKSVLTLFICLVTLHVIAQRPDSTAEVQHGMIIDADSQMANHQFEKALDLLLNCDSLDAGVLLRIGQCNSRLGRARSAIRTYERVLSLDSGNRIALNQLGQLYGGEEDFKSALRCYLHLINKDTTNSYYHRQAGFMAAKLNDHIRSEFLYTRALRLNPADTEAALALGTLLLDVERFQSADSIVERALSLDPRNKRMLLLKARSAFEQKRFETVVSTIHTILQKSDTTTTHARLLGASYFHLREYKEVTSWMMFLLRNSYESDWVYYYLGVASRELGNPDVSIIFLKAAVQMSISENTETYYSQLGLSYEKVGDFQGAIQSYRAAYNYSREGILLYHLARTYDAYYKDKATALLYYQKYLQSDDTIRPAKEYARKRLQDMGHF